MEIATTRRPILETVKIDFFLSILSSIQGIIDKKAGKADGS